MAYSDFQSKSASSKVGLARLRGSQRLKGWSLSSGAIYTRPFTEELIESITDDGVSVSEGSSTSLSSGEYFLDAGADLLYIRLSDDTDPNLSFIASTTFFHFATQPVIAPNDPSDSTSAEILWQPQLRQVSEFGTELDSRQLGVAIEGSGSISLYNDQEYWRERFDSVFFDNKQCEVWSWSDELDITEAKLIYRGRVVSKSWDQASIKFGLKDRLNELRQPVELPAISEITDNRVPDSLKDAKQRRLYGRINGLRPLNIDQLVNGQVRGLPRSGTITLTNGSDAVTGVGTTFLNDFAPEDEIAFDVDGEVETVTIQSIQTDTTATLSSEFDDDTLSGITYRLLPTNRSKRFQNRKFAVSGFPTRELSTTISNTFTLSAFEVADVTDFKEGDQIFIDGERAFIELISGDTIRLVANLAGSPSVGSVVERPSVSNVRIDTTLLVPTTTLEDGDYEYDADEGVLTLDELAEFNRAPERNITGTSITVTSGSRTVTGSGTSFILQLRPHDWIRVTGNSEFFEVLQINSDTSLDLRTAATYTDTDSGIFRSPKYYNEQQVGDEAPTVLTTSVLGSTLDNTKSGKLLETCGAIVKDLITRAGIEAADIDSDSYDDADGLVPHVLSLRIPESRTAKAAPTVRSQIDLVNTSVFGSFIQRSNDFKLSYRVLTPDKPDISLVLREEDVISFSTRTEIDKIIKTIVYEYDPREYDPDVETEFSPIITKTSDIAEFLTGNKNEETISSLIVDPRVAEQYATRWALIKEIGTTRVTLKIKMAAHLLDATDKVDLSHEKLFVRFGSEDQRKILFIQSIKKSATGATIVADDLGATFTRCAAIMLTGANDFSDATETELTRGGHITDTNGLQDNDGETDGINVIF